MANKTIGQLNSMTPSSTTELAIYDGSSTGKATVSDLLDTENLVYADDAQTPTSTDVDFKSQDTSLTPSSTTSVDLLQGTDSWSQRFVKVSQMFKNIRWILKKIGSTDITSLDSNGTLTGAISTLNNNLNTFQKNYYQYSNNGNITEIGASKIGKIVTVSILQRTAGSWTRGQFLTLVTLDTKYAPTMGTLNFPIVDNSSTTSLEGTIGIGQIVWKTGVVRIWLYNNITRNSAIRGTITYILQ